VANNRWAFAQSPRKAYRVKIIERDPERCRYLSETLETRCSLNGDAVERQGCCLKKISRSNRRVFCALTTNDEANNHVVQCWRSIGAFVPVMTIINNLLSVDIVQEGHDRHSYLASNKPRSARYKLYSDAGAVVKMYSLDCRKGASRSHWSGKRHGVKSFPQIVGESIAIWTCLKVQNRRIVRQDDMIARHQRSGYDKQKPWFIFCANKKQIPSGKSSSFKWV